MNPLQGVSMLGRITPLLTLVLLTGCTAGSDLSDEGEAIRLSALVSFGTDDGPGSFVQFPLPSALTARGMYVVADEGQRGGLTAFDSTGAFVQTIGRFGAGPGEFRRASRVIVVEGDSLLAVDDQLKRGTMISPDLVPRRAFPLPLFPFDIAAVGRSLVVASTGSPSADSAIIVFDVNGVVHAGFTPPSEPGTPPLPFRLAADGGSFSTVRWAGPLRLERWDSNGTLQQVVQPRSDWTTPFSNAPMSPDTPPASQVQGIWVTSDGYLGILGLVADPDWADGLGTPVQSEGGITVYPIVDRDQVFDSIIELIDPATQEVVATRRFDKEYRLVPFPGVVERIEETNEGALRAVLYNVSWQRPGASVR